MGMQRCPVNRVLGRFWNRHLETGHSSQESGVSLASLHTRAPSVGLCTSLSWVSANGKGLPHSSASLTFNSLLSGEEESVDLLPSHSRFQMYRKRNSGLDHMTAPSSTNCGLGARAQHTGGRLGGLPEWSLWAGKILGSVPLSMKLERERRVSRTESQTPLGYKHWL